MREQNDVIRVLVMMTMLVTTGLATFSLTAHADKLADLDATMQVLDDVADLDKNAAYLRVPDEGDESQDDSVDEAANFDDEFEYDVGFEEDLMQDEDDFEDGDDVDDDRIDAESAATF